MLDTLSALNCCIYIFVQLIIDLRVFSLYHMVSALMQWADSKDASGNNERDTTLNQLPTEMDGTGIGVANPISINGVIVMTATSRKGCAGCSSHQAW